MMAAKVPTRIELARDLLAGHGFVFMDHGQGRIQVPPGSATRARLVLLGAGIVCKVEVLEIRQKKRECVVVELPDAADGRADLGRVA